MPAGVGLQCLCIGTCAAVLLSTSVPAMGAQWYAHPTLIMRTEYNDNLHLLPKDHTSVWGAVAQADVVLGVRSEVAGLRLDPSYSLTRYTGEDGLNHNDQSVSVNAYHQSETQVLNLDASYVRDSTLVSELLNSGRVQVNRPRRFIDAQPSWAWQWSKRGNLHLTGGYSETSYSEGIAVGLIDYHTIDGTVGTEYALDRRNKLGIVASASRFRAPALYNTSDSLGLQGTWNSHWSERLESTLNAGWQINRNRYTGIGFSLQDTQSGFVVDADLKHRSERNSWSTSASRSVEPSSLGVLTRRDRWSARLNHGFSEYMNSSVDALWLHSQSVQSSVVSDDRTLYQMDLSLNWYFSENYTLSGRYSWIRQKAGYSATANAVTISITYSDIKHSVNY